MADYAQWNDAIIGFHTRNVPKGDPVYLTVNESAIGMVGKAMLGISGNDAAYADFIAAVRQRCTTWPQERRSVLIDGLEGIDEDTGLPKGVAFLSAMVLAAHKMASKEGADNNNYFVRLRQVLGLNDTAPGRPEGLDPGVEEPCWKSWGMWLDSNGWLNTAETVGDGPMRYISYPIGQALLRDDDVVYLRRLFKEKIGHPSLDEAQLAGWLLRQGFSRSHLRSGFESPDPGRASAFFDEAYKVYQGVDWSQDGASVVAGQSRPNKIVAGILCQHSMNGGEVFRLLPRIPMHWQGDELVAKGPNGDDAALVPYRPGLFRPLWQVNPFQEDALSFRVEGSDSIEEIVMPSRDYWILTPDPPDDPHGALATWDKYPALMGVKFRLMVKGAQDGRLAQEVVRFKDYRLGGQDAGLIGWDSGPIDVSGWTEFHGCMVLSAAWDSIIPHEDAAELFEALKPSLRATIALSGGLRDSSKGAWIEGCPPSAKIYGFDDEFGFRIVKDGAILHESRYTAQAPFQLDECKKPGLYRLEALWDKRVVAGKALRVIPWDLLEVDPIDGAKWVDIGSESFISGPRRIASKGVRDA
uniref:Uncharacterized protein n=1 Tax=Chlorobium phaeovibrioides (strain DSM 265 / 1930) TaxID=290318 RepID=A4SC89_CHLPM